MSAHTSVVRMLDIPAIEKALAGAADPAKAAGMSAYMRGQFPFLGVPAGPRGVVTKGLLPREVDWDGIFQILDHHEQREFHYVAGDAIYRATLTRADLPQLRRFLTTKSWWDTVDLVAKKVGSVAEPGDMLEWSVDENLWVRRVAIIHQLGRVFSGRSSGGTWGRASFSWTRPSGGRCATRPNTTPTGCAGSWPTRISAR